jgi:putative peptidoglycan lipid II flippase
MPQKGSMSPLQVSDVNAKDIALPSLRLFWVLSFTYASFMALLLQKVLLPLFPDMHAGHGLLMNDAIVFHNMAVEIAQRIRAVGWSEWSVYSANASANVGLLSALYALFGPDPAWFIPFNAAAHATGAMLIYRLGIRIVDGDIGKLGSLLAAICFLVFPSALQWYGQNHKDAFAILGLLLMLDAWLAIHDEQFRIQYRSIVGNLLIALAGGLLLGLVRPYFVVVITFGFLTSFLVASIWHSRFGLIAVRLSLILLLALLAILFTRMGTAKDVYSDETVGTYVQKDFQWKKSEYVPEILEKTLQRASELRSHFVYFGRSVGAGSEVDGNHLPDTSWSALAYLPRALIVGLFTPFPNTWGERVTLPRLIGAMETAFWYLVCLGVAVTLVRHRSRKLLAGAIVCAVLITILAYIHPNIGTLYRQRYGFWHFFMLIGFIGWASLLRSHLTPGTSSSQIPMNAPASYELSFPDPLPADRFAGSGAVVMLITLACYLGFFARDLLLTGHLGLGTDLDAFFAAAMIPMFFVSCLAIPLGDAMVLPFVAAQYHPAAARVRLLQGTLGLALCMLVGATCFVWFSAPWLVTWVLRAATEVGQEEAVSLLRWFAPIIAMSAWTVVGNAALNSLGKPRVAAKAQLAVPVVTLLALVLAPSGHIMAASIGGMLLGTFINAAIVSLHLRAHGLVMLPASATFDATAGVRAVYWPLVAAAVLPAALVPMNYAFASSVGAGTVAAWAFASKIVVLFAGLSSVGATAVVLPQMAKAFILRVGDERQRQDANRLIAVGVWCGGVLMIGGALFAEPLVAALLGKQLALSQISVLADIVRIGLMQIPVVIVGALANKLAIASGRTSRVLYSAIVGFSGNILVNLTLVPALGVTGVAVGALVGSMLSVVAVLAGAYRQIGLSPRDVMIAVAGWLAWVAVCVALLSTSAAALVCALITLGVVAKWQWALLRTNKVTPVFA